MHDLVHRAKGQISPLNVILLIAMTCLGWELCGAYRLNVARHQLVLASIDVMATDSGENAVRRIRSFRDPKNGGVLQSLLRVNSGQSLVLNGGTVHDRQVRFDQEIGDENWYVFWVQLASHVVQEASSPNFQTLKISLSNAGAIKPSRDIARMSSSRFTVSDGIGVSLTNDPVMINSTSLLRKLGLLPDQSVMDLYLTPAPTPKTQ